MRYSAILLVVLSLAFKLHGNYAVPSDDMAGALRQLAANLSRDSYSSQVEIGARNRVTAQRGECRLVARMLDPHATGLANIVRTLGSEGAIAYVWRGTWRTGPPRFAPLIEYYIKREAVRQGFAMQRHPVWIVALGSGCIPRPEARFADVTAILHPTT